MDTTNESQIFIQLLVILVLTLINGFFSGAEIALVSVNKTRVRFLAEEGDKRALLLEKLIEEPSKFLSTIQVGITLAGFFASAQAATGLSKYLAVFLESVNIPHTENVSVILVTLFLSYITLVFGELVPKRVALKFGEKIALSTVGIITVISNLFAPTIKLLTFSTNTVLKLFGMMDKNIEEKISKEEIRALVEAGSVHGTINESERNMIENIIEFDEKVAREIMIPRTKVFLIEKDEEIDEIFQKKEFFKYSRIPVYEKEMDNIIGILYVKDLIKVGYLKGFENIKIAELLHDGHYVPETKNVNELFSELQREKKHIAILIDEYGGFSGIVTLEDIIEEVMGNIFDEFDDVDLSIKQLSDKKFIVDGELSLNDVNDYFEIELDSQHYDTLSGLLIEKLGYIPEDNENIGIIEIDNIKFKPKRVKNKTIEKVLILFE